MQNKDQKPTDFDNSHPNSIVRKHKGTISVEIRKYTTSALSAWKSGAGKININNAANNVQLTSKWNLSILAKREPYLKTLKVDTCGSLKEKNPPF